MSLTKQNLIVNNTQLLHRLAFTTKEFVTIVHGYFYSYKTVITCSEPPSVERRVSFAVEIMTASGNWKHPLS